MVKSDKLIGVEYYIQARLPIWNVDLAVKLLAAQYINEKILNNKNSDEVLELLKDKYLYTEKLYYYEDYVVKLLSENNLYHVTFTHNIEEIELSNVCFLRTIFLNALIDDINLDIDIDLMKKYINNHNLLIYNLISKKENESVVKSIASKIILKNKYENKKELFYKIRLYIKKEIDSGCKCWHDIITGRIIEIYKNNKHVKYIKKSEIEDLKEKGKRYNISKNFTKEDVMIIAKDMYIKNGLKNRVYNKNEDHSKERDIDDCPIHGKMHQAS